MREKIRERGCLFDVADRRGLPGKPFSTKNGRMKRRKDHQSTYECNLVSTCYRSSPWSVHPQGKSTVRGQGAGQGIDICPRAYGVDGKLGWRRMIRRQTQGTWGQRVYAQCTSGRWFQTAFQTEWNPKKAAWNRMEHPEKVAPTEHMETTVGAHLVSYHSSPVRHTHRRRKGIDQIR